MRRLTPAAVPASLFTAFALLVLWLPGCSAEETDRRDTGGPTVESIRAGGGGPFPRGRGGEAAPIARTGGRVAVERTVLSSAGERDLVYARVEYEGSWNWPRCSLLEAPDVAAVRGTIEDREVPRAQGYTRVLWEEGLWKEHGSLWADRSTIEKSLQDDGAVIWIFHEDPKPEGEAADPRRTPFFVRCVGGDLPGVVHDLAPVSGSPG